MQMDPVPPSARDGVAGSDEPFDLHRLAEMAAGCGHFEIRVATWTVVWTPGLADLLGRPMPPSGVMDLDRHFKFYVAEDRDAVRRRFVDFVSAPHEDGSRAYRNHGRILRPDGEIRDVAIQGVARARDGRLETLLGVVVDVTGLSRAERSARETNDFLRTTFEAMDQGILIVGADQRIRVHSRRARQLTGVPEHVVCDGLPFADLLAHLEEAGEFATLPPEHREELPLAAAENGPRIYTRRRPDGSLLEVRTSRLPDGGFVRVYGDVTERELRGAALADSERRFRLLAENTTDTVIWSDIDSTRRYVSPAVRTLLGYEPEELIGTKPIDFVHPDEVRAFAVLLAALNSWDADKMTTSQRYRRKDGRYVWVEISFSLVRDSATGQPTSYVAALRDISDRKAVEERLRTSQQRLSAALEQATHLAAHDTLTGLPNRHSFQHALERRLASGDAPCALLGCDLDAFKGVNDTLGHAGGDRLLVEVAHRLRAAIGPGDEIGRIGGDEFAVLTDAEGAEGLAHRLVSIAAEPFLLDGQRVQIGMSVGIAVAQSIESIDRLARNADAAMYHAKRESRNGVSLYTAALEAHVAERTALTCDLRDAVSAGGLNLHYQPIVDLASGEVRAFEALLRWDHPTRGAIEPAVFIALAEQTGLIVPLGAWVLREACEAAASWDGKQRVCVNVSAVQFQTVGGLEEAVFLALAASRLDPWRLEIEITETVLIRDTAPVIACLQRLRGLGIKVALDDFGTGFSSLNYLRQFPFDTVKLDRSFVHDLDSEGTRIVVKAVVGLARSFAARVVAEGIETLAELAMVQEAGCGEAQGFLFCRPLVRAQAEEMVARKAPGRSAA